MTNIINLSIVLQSKVGKRARKNIVRQGKADGPYRDREILIETDISVGAGSGANADLRKTVLQALRKNVRKGEILFYVVAEFEPANGADNYFKTVVPRSEIPLSIRRV